MAGASATTPDLLLAAIVAEASPNLTAVKLGSPPQGMEDHAAERLWLDITVPPLDGPDWVLPQWQGQMIAGSYNDAAAADGLALIGGISTYHASGDRPDAKALENADPPIPQPWPDTATL